MTKARKRKRDMRPTKHHIIPRSRNGSSNLENIAIVSNIKHQKYHNLFYNLTPVEIIETLVSDYWNNNWDYVQSAYRRNNEL